MADIILVQIQEVVNLVHTESTKSYANVTWEKATKQNYGVDFTVLKDHLNVSFDYFYEKRKDILMTPNYLPSILGMSLPVVNVGKTENKGFELQLKWNDQVGKDFPLLGKC